MLENMAAKKSKHGKTTTPSKAGRRSGENNTRNDILTAATHLFAERGFEGASMRAIAATAKVDPALIRHFFGNKESLFTAVTSTQDKANHPVTIDFLDTSATQGEAIVRAYLHAWNSPETQPLLLSLLRSATTTTDENITNALWSFFTTGHLGTVIKNIDPIAFALLSAQLLGLATGRYLLKLPNMVALSDQRIINELSPVIQRYIDGTYQTNTAPPTFTPTPPGNSIDFPSMDAPVAAPHPREKTANTPTPAASPETHSTPTTPPNETPTPDISPVEDLLITEEIPAQHPSHTTPEPPKETKTPTYTRPALNNAHEPTLFGEEEPEPTTPKPRPHKATEEQPSLFDRLF